MTISQAQTVDLLNKKLASLAKTDVSTAKGPSNETIASPLLVPGSTIWQLDSQLVNTPTLPTSNSSVVTVYRDSLSTTIQCTRDGTASGTNQTWLTNLIDWVPPSFGSGYQIQLYAAPVGYSANVMTSGVSLAQAGSGNNDSWTFDYQAGVINFADTNVPTSVTWNGTTGNVVYAVGARYTGTKGIGNFTNGLQFGNVSVIGNVISSTVGNLVIPQLTTSNIGISGGYISNVANLYATTGSITNFSSSNVQITGGNLINMSLENITTLQATNFSTANAQITGGNLINMTLENVTSLQATNFSTANAQITGGNVTAGTITISNSSISSPDVITFYSVGGAITLPVGGNIARPNSPVAGEIRFNTDYQSVEFYNGQGWINIINSIDGQNFYGDGVNNTYILNHFTTSSGVLVSINGTVQQPGFAYNISGTQITFTETPLASDQIDIRYLAASTANANDITVIDTGNVTVGTGATTFDVFPTNMYRSVKYTLSSTNGVDQQISDVLVIHNGTNSFITTVSNLRTGSNSLTFTTSLALGNVTVQATGTTGNNKVRIQRTYFQV
jgi:hypothetical protein